MEILSPESAVLPVPTLISTSLTLVELEARLILYSSALALAYYW